MKESKEEMSEDQLELDNALKHFVNFRETVDHSYYEHTYTLPGHKKYYSGYNSPAKYLFTSPLLPNLPIEASSSSNDLIDVETLDHELPSYYDYEKLNEQFIDANEVALPFDENWMDKIDRKGWNVIKVRLFRTAVQILENDYHSRLAYKGLRDEAVKRHLMSKKSALRLKFLFCTVSWDPPTCQWLHSLLMEKLPACYVKIYTDAFQCLEAKVPAHFLEHMTISTAYMSVRSRLSGIGSQNNLQKKDWDPFSQILSQQRPNKIGGDPLLVLLPTNMGNSYACNSRPFRFMTELSSLGDLITITCPRNYSGNAEIPTLLEQMIQATVTKIIELQTSHSNRPIILIGMGSSSLLACHIAMGFSQKVTAVVCVGCHIFTMEGKVSKANNKLSNMKTPVLFVIGQNATNATVDEVEEFRLRLKCRNGLIVVGGGDDHLRVNRALKCRRAITQSIADRCIINEIADFLNDIMQPTKVLLSILSSNDTISAKGKPVVSSMDAQELKKILSETVNEPYNAPIIEKLTKTLVHQLQNDHEYEALLEKNSNSKRTIDPSKISVRSQLKRINEQGRKLSVANGSSMQQQQSLLRSTSKDAQASRLGQSNSVVMHRLKGFDGGTKLTFHTSLAPVNFTRKTRGGRRPYMRRTIPPKRPTLIRTNTTATDSKSLNFANSSSIENLTPDSILDLPVVFADENDSENLITNSFDVTMV